MNKNKVAREAYRAVADFDSENGIGSPTWGKLDKHVQNIEKAMLAYHLENKDSAPQATHMEWLKQMEAQGWKKGEKLDAKGKTHPSLKPYSSLSDHEKARYGVFMKAVKEAVELDEEQPEEES